jgi:enamine deaminase RidA (YjgF/YER057c/UK114 family)
MLTNFPRLTAVLAGIALSGLAAAGARQDGSVIMPQNPDARKAYEAWGLADAVVTGDTIYLSGVVAWLPKDSADLEASYTRAFDEIAAVLQRAGASWDDVVEITTYHTDLPAQLDALVKVKARYVAAPFPAWTAIEVTRLVPDQGITEIRVIARKSAG